MRPLYEVRTRWVDYGPWELSYTVTSFEGAEDRALERLSALRTGTMLVRVTMVRAAQSDIVLNEWTYLEIA